MGAAGRGAGPAPASRATKPPSGPFGEFLKLDAASNVTQRQDMCLRCSRPWADRIFLLIGVVVFASVTAFLIFIATGLAASAASSVSRSWIAAAGVFFIALVFGIASLIVMVACAFSFVGRVMYRVHSKNSSLVLIVASSIGPVTIRRKVIKWDGPRVTIELAPLYPGCRELIRLKSRGQVHWFGLYHTSAQCMQLASWLESLRSVEASAGSGGIDPVLA